MFERYLTSWDRDDIFSKKEHGLGWDPHKSTYMILHNGQKLQ